MNALAQRIAGLVRVDGPMSVAQFMSIALHDPALGYYATHDPIGAGGDFITAPEISQMFGELLGLWCVQAWRDQGSPAPVRLVELGPGRGTLMADVLRVARCDPKFLDSIDVVLIETSERLRQAQAEKLKTAPTALRWEERFNESLADRPLFLLANEFFDSLPIRQFVFTNRGWCERMVDVGEDDGDLRFVISPFPIPLNIPDERGAPRVGDIYEVCPAGEAVVEQAAAVIANARGAALIVDYGHSGMGVGETLQAVAGHKYASVLENPGEADLSAHVDFAALARAAERGGAHTFGPVEQGALLQSLGIKPRAAKLMQNNPDQRDAIASAGERLISAEQMGILFKALAILPEHAPKPPGF